MRPRWGIGGAPAPPSPGMYNQYMSNADLAHYGMPVPGHQARAPAGGAEVDGRRFAGGQILPSGSSIMVVGGLLRLSFNDGHHEFRAIRMPVPIGTTAADTARAWDRFIQRWRDWYDFEVERVR